MLSPRNPKAIVNKGGKFLKKLKHTLWRGANARNFIFGDDILRRQIYDINSVDNNKLAYDRKQPVYSGALW